MNHAREQKKPPSCGCETFSRCRGQQTNQGPGPLLGKSSGLLRARSGNGFAALSPLTVPPSLFAVDRRGEKAPAKTCSAGPQKMPSSSAFTLSSGSPSARLRAPSPRAAPSKGKKKKADLGPRPGGPGASAARAVDGDLPAGTLANFFSISPNKHVFPRRSAKSVGRRGDGKSGIWGPAVARAA